MNKTYGSFQPAIDEFHASIPEEERDRIPLYDAEMFLTMTLDMMLELSNDDIAACVDVSHESDWADEKKLKQTMLYLSNQLKWFANRIPD